MEYFNIPKNYIEEIRNYLDSIVEQHKNADEIIENMHRDIDDPTLMQGHVLELNDLHFELGEKYCSLFVRSGQIYWKTPTLQDPKYWEENYRDL